MNYLYPVRSGKMYWQFKFSNLFVPTFITIFIIPHILFASTITILLLVSIPVYTTIGFCVFYTFKPREFTIGNNIIVKENGNQITNLFGICILKPIYYIDQEISLCSSNVNIIPYFKLDDLLYEKSLIWQIIYELSPDLKTFYYKDVPIATAAPENYKCTVNTLFDTNSYITKFLN